MVLILIWLLARREPASFFLFQNLLHAWTEIVAPVAQLLDDGDEGAAKVGEAVLGMAADGIDDLLLDDAVLHKFLQLLGKHAFAGLGHAALEFAGALWAIQKFVDDVWLPLAAHYFDGDAEAAVDVYGYLLVVHCGCKITKIWRYCENYQHHSAKIISIHRFCSLKES